jgi:hypothetical protein
MIRDVQKAPASKVGRYNYEEGLRRSGLPNSLKHCQRSRS